MLLKDILQDEKNVNNLKVKVIMNRKESIIVGDSSMMAIFSPTNTSYENMIEGSCYMIIKPTKQDSNSFTANEKLKPVKIKAFTVPTKKIELNRLQSIIEQLSPKVDDDLSKGKLKTFKDIQDLVPNSELKSIIVKVITISKTIAGQYGPYNIAKLKDVNNEKMDINLYNKQITKRMNRGCVLELRNLKITEFSRDGEKNKRLSTTSRSIANPCSLDKEKLFENIPIGDQREEGTVLAVNDIFSYLSCSSCWKRTIQEDTTCQCGNKEDIHNENFHCQFYIQLKKDDEVKIVHTFSRVTNLTPKSYQIEDLQEALDSKYLEKSFTFEWNENVDEDKLTMVLINDQ